MGVQDLFEANSDWLMSEDNFGEPLILFDPNYKPAAQTPFDGIVAFAGSDPIVMGDNDETHEEGAVEVPMSIAVPDNGWFVRADGEELKVRGRGGRDQHTQTILVTRVKKQAVKIARRRG